jgi:hypothetical protein
MDGFQTKDISYSAYSLLLEAAPPGILSGDAKEEAAFLKFSDEQRQSYFRALKRLRKDGAAGEAERESQEFRLEGARILPTTRVDGGMISDAVGTLTGDDFICLSPIAPIRCEKGNFTTLQCAVPPDKPALRHVECIFSDGGEISLWRATADIGQTRRFFENLYMSGEIPNLKTLPDFEALLLADL